MAEPIFLNDKPHRRWKVIGVILAAFVGGTLLDVVIRFCGVQAADPDPAHVDWGLVVLPTMLGVPALVGYVSGRIVGGSTTMQVVTGGTGGALFSAITMLIWFFTRPPWWPADEQAYFLAIFVIWVSMALVGATVSVLVSQYTRK